MPSLLPALPGAIVASVGGGGLLCGIYQGLARHGWDDVTVVATETEGAASFYEAFRAGKLVRLDRIATVATSLGALEVSEQALVYSRKQPTVPLVSHAAMQGIIWRHYALGTAPAIRQPARQWP